MTDKERDVERYLVKRVKTAGGEVRKAQWTGRKGAPDRLVLLPGFIVWVELKRPGEKATAQQAREHDRLREAGQFVYVLNSREEVDWLFSVWGLI